MESKIDELPVEILHHIQSLMEPKQAARISTLSKSWYHAWSTRPVLVFDQTQFPARLDIISSGFRAFATKTIQRYMDLNLKVNKFIL